MSRHSKNVKYEPYYAGGHINPHLTLFPVIMSFRDERGYNLTLVSKQKL